MCMVQATARIRGEPGKVQLAEETWAFEMKYCYLHEPVNWPEERPAVSYKDGVYTVTGFICTNFSGYFSIDSVLDFTPDEPWDWDQCLDANRIILLVSAHKEKLKFMGRSQ